jgi:hypothetical protein
LLELQAFLEALINNRRGLRRHHRPLRLLLRPRCSQHSLRHTVILHRLLNPGAGVVPADSCKALCQLRLEWRGEPCSFKE